MLIATLLIFLTLSIVMNVYFIRVSLQLQERLEDTLEQTEQSLDIIDQQYAKIAKIIKMPILHDDQHVRQFVNAMKKSHDSLLVIANKITGPESTNNVRN
jgi:hypothetical protein